MHRDLTATAALLGIGPRKLRLRLRELGILDKSGLVASAHRDRGYLFVETRSRWNGRIKSWTHYGVVMTTEKGVAWLAEQLGIAVQRMPAPGEAA